VSLLSLVLVAALAAGPAAPRVAAKAVRSLTLEVRELRFREAAAAVLTPFGADYRVAGQVDDFRVSFSLKNATLDQAVRALVRAGRTHLPDLTAYHTERYSIMRRWGRGSPGDTARSAVELPGLEERVSLSLSGATLHEALLKLSEGCSLQYPPPPGVPGDAPPPPPQPVYLPWIMLDAELRDVTVTLHVNHVTPHLAILLLVYAASESGVRVFATKESENYILRTHPTAAGPPPVDDAKQVSLKLRRTPLRTAVQWLSEAAGGRWLVERSLPDVPITLEFEDLAPEVAIRRIVAVGALQARGLTYTRAGRMFLIHWPGTER